MSETKLEACPFCGEQAERMFSNRRNVHCPIESCPAYVLRIDEDEWNNRHSPSPSFEAVRERCAKLADDYDGKGRSCPGYDAQLGDSLQTSMDISAAIRALREEDCRG